MLGSATTATTIPSVCPAGFMLFDASCIACAGPGAALDVNGVCRCADFATFIDSAVCQCSKNYLPFNDGCRMCSGVGAFFDDAGLCSCGTGAMLTVVDNLRQCVCPVNLVQSGDVCIECDGGTFSRVYFLQ